VDDAATRAQAIGAGWRGALGRQIGAERLGAAVFAVAAGLVVSDAAAALATEEDAGAPVRLREPLTSREGEVLQLLASGFSNRRIGQRLGISEHTAKFHVAAVLGKLEARTRTDAVVRAARLGLIVL
jgi:DNA-binding NarL/FixJ family response regulator